MTKSLPSGLSHKDTQDYYTRILDQQKQDRYNTWRTEVSRTSGPTPPPTPPAKVPGAGEMLNQWKQTIPDLWNWGVDLFKQKGWP